MGILIWLAVFGISMGVKFGWLVGLAAFTGAYVLMPYQRGQ